MRTSLKPFLFATRYSRPGHSTDSRFVHRKRVGVFLPVGAMLSHVVLCLWRIFASFSWKRNTEKWAPPRPTGLMPGYTTNAAVITRRYTRETRQGPESWLYNCCGKLSEEATLEAVDQGRASGHDEFCLTLTRELEMAPFWGSHLQNVTGLVSVWEVDTCMAIAWLRLSRLAGIANGHANNVSTTKLG